jgi:hypothetical protein
MEWVGSERWRNFFTRGLNSEKTIIMSDGFLKPRSLIAGFNSLFQTQVTDEPLARRRPAL